MNSNEKTWHDIPDGELLEELRNHYQKPPFIDGVQWAKKRLKELNQHLIETSDEKKE